MGARAGGDGLIATEAGGGNGGRDAGEGRMTDRPAGWPALARLCVAAGAAVVGIDYLSASSPLA
jgi:hypothetical protein